MDSLSVGDYPSNKHIYIIAITIHIIAITIHLYSKTLLYMFEISFFVSIEVESTTHNAPKQRRHSVGILHKTLNLNTKKALE